MNLRLSPLLLALLASACHGDGQPPQAPAVNDSAAPAPAAPEPAPAPQEAANAQPGSSNEHDDQAAAEAATPLLANGSFETGDSKPWVLSMHSDPTSFSLHVDSDHAFDGDFSARIDSTGKEPWGSIRQYLADPVLADGGRWRLAFAARGQGTSEPLSVFVRSRGSGTRTVPEERLEVPLGDWDWQPLEWEFDLPDGTRRLELAITHYGTGSLWLDAITLERLEDRVKPDGK